MWCSIRKNFERRGAALCALVVLALFAATTAGAQLRVANLKCEFAVDPLGVDVVQPRLFWRLASDERGQRQTAFQILVAASPDALAADRGELWDSGKIASDETAFVRYGGAKLASLQTVFWKIRAWDRDDQPSAWSAPAQWTMGLLTAGEWKGAWIAAPAATEALLLRREFAVKPGLRRALVCVCGLGEYELFFNGTKVSEDLLAPGWTNFEKTTLYDTRDVTALLTPGVNATGIALGNGMYNVVRRDRFAKFTNSFGPLRAVLHLRLEYADGSVDFVGTDPQWRTSAGPLTFTSIYGGEDFDARRLPAGWNRAGFDDRAWPAAVLVNRPADTLRGQTHAAEPIRAIETRAPVSVRDLKPGVVLYDFGQNASFMPRLRVSGPAGSAVRLHPAEVVNADGTIDRGTMGGAHRGGQWWQYTKATDGEETWFPQFYYVGSRYLYAELTPAAPGGAWPKIESLEDVIVHSTAAPLGKFATSNPLLNQIRDLVRWAQRSNMVSVLTDCPHREKLGWIEQYHLNGPSIRYEFDVARIYQKGMRDMAEAQTDDGLIPNIAPEYTEFKGAFRNAAEWGAAFILVPWQQYQFTGDRDLLRTHFDAMKRYFAFLESRTKDDILTDGLGDWYDMELPKKGRAGLTPAPITATAFYFYDAHILAQIAAVLGRDADARDYAERAARIRASYNRKFFHAETQSYATGSQASLALPLVMGIVEPANRAAVLAALVRDVDARGYATAGDVAFRSLLQALAEGGRSDVVYRMINQREKPGYGYQLKQGATALAESWDAGRGASQDHFMLGQVIEWFYKDLAGIDTDPSGPGFKKILVRPQPAGDLTWVEASYDSIHGPIAVRWEHQGEKFSLKATIPANTTATVFVPAHEGATVQEGGAPAANRAGVSFLRREGDRMVYAVESGSYEFSSQW